MRAEDTPSIKAQICDVCHKMWQLDRVAANGGNVSVKKDNGTWRITPSGISKAFITPDKLIRVDRDKNVVEGPAGYKPSSEMKIKRTPMPLLKASCRKRPPNKRKKLLPSKPVSLR